MGRTTKRKPLQRASKDKGSDQKTQVTQSPSEQTAASVKSGSSTKRREPKPDHSPIPENISGDFWQPKETLETKLAATLEGEEEKSLKLLPSIEMVKLQLTMALDPKSLM